MAKAMAITGAGRGIGRAIALRCARDGWAVALSDLDAASAAQVAREITAAGGRALPAGLDVTDPSATRAWVDAVDLELGGLTGAVSNAGIINIQPFLEVTPETWRRVMAVNLDGAAFFVQAVLRHMTQRRAGSVVMIASAASRLGSMYSNVYNTSKTALHGLTRALAIECGPFGVRVNAVSPGVVDTQMWQQIDRERGRILGKPTGHVFRESIERIPLGRAETPEDVAKICAYVLSDEADYMTGQNISYDGGMAMP
ncbi:MAG: SDR family oxidoreductase [Actinobacteria bacterium]|nr:SDR family oxidoreductase [Actinomycetota bacterium]